jgi:hypothetical protein
VGLGAALLAVIASLAATSTSTKPPSAPLPPSGAPRYQNYAPPPALGQSAGEPSIGVNPATGKVFFVAHTQTLRINFDDCSSPAKALWEDVTPPTSVGQTLDPILFTDRITGRTFTSQLLGKTSEMFFTDTDGQTWTQSQGSGINSGADHQTIGGGPFATGAPPHPTYTNATYYCSQDIAAAQCALSIDGGQTFGPAVPIYNISQCAGIHGHVKVAPDGTAYIPNKSCGGKQGIAVSENNGITWTLRTLPDSISVSGIIDPSLAIGSDGTLYFAYRQGGAEPGLGRAMVAVSQNKGVSWSPSVNVGAEFGLNNVTFPEAVAGDGDRAAVAFVGTTSDGDYQAPIRIDHDGNPATPTIVNPNGFKGEWHIYIAHTYNRGATWTMTDATPTDPVQRNSICNSGTTCGNVPDDRNLLDFNDMTVDKEGRALVAYSDGCVSNACLQGLDTDGDGFKQNDYTAIAKIARQSGGPRLFSQFDPTEPAVPGAPNVTAIRDGSGVVQLSWPVPDDGGSPITEYRVYRRIASGTYGAPLATVTTNSYADATATDLGTTYFYRVTAVNALGESPFCGEVSPTAATDPCVEPGLPILADPTGDSLDMLPSHDVQAFSLSEPYAVGSNKLVFTLKVASLSTVPPDTQWPVNFKAPNATNWIVRMNSGGLGTPATPRFEYGPQGGLPIDFVVADAASSFNVDGTIRIVVPTSGIGNPQVGQSLTLFLTRIAVSPSVGPTLTPDNMPDSLAPSGSYTLVGNAFCRPNAAPIPILTANPTSGIAPLQVDFDGSASFDPDTDPPADTIASYTFNFGDGSAEVMQSTATIQHTYMNAGVYQATLRVTDSRGKASAGAADKTITVQNAGALVNYALTSRGSTPSASSTQSSRNYSAAGAFDGDSTGVGWEQGGGWNDNTRGLWPDNLDIAFGGAAKTISEIDVYTLQNNFHSPTVPDENTDASFYGILDFQVQTWNGVTWVTVPGGMITGNMKVLRRITLASPITTAKVRVLVTNGRSYYSRIVELECYGAPGQP